MVFRSPRIRADHRQSSILPLQPKINDEKDNKCVNPIDLISFLHVKSKHRFHKEFDSQKSRREEERRRNTEAWLVKSQLERFLKNLDILFLLFNNSNNMT